ncbi:MAG: SDR family NAD(P)-dependent oxidoreductase, partial [Alphaproteobacteria bacterium]
MASPLHGQTAIVTGGNGGIGRILCARLLKLGATVVSLDIGHRDWPDSMADAQRIDADLGNEAAVEDAFAQVMR